MGISTIKDWANQNEGFLAVILFLLPLIVALIIRSSKWFLKKFSNRVATGQNFLVGNKTFTQKSGKNSTNIQGEDITLNRYNGKK
jgi:hypothetical protein